MWQKKDTVTKQEDHHQQDLPQNLFFEILSISNFDLETQYPEDFIVWN